MSIECRICNYVLGHEITKLEDCPDCKVSPGQPHLRGCGVEACSLCGGQRFSCSCSYKEGRHDPLFARWTGIWPGIAEGAALRMCLNCLYISGVHKKVFVKPKKKK